MGGQTFCISARGATAQAAFHAAHSEACHEHGHGNYVFFGWASE